MTGRDPWHGWRATGARNHGPEPRPSCALCTVFPGSDDHAAPAVGLGSGVEPLVADDVPCADAVLAEAPGDGCQEVAGVRLEPGNNLVDEGLCGWAPILAAADHTQVVGEGGRLVVDHAVDRA